MTTPRISSVSCPKIAILGGGISALSAAFFLSQSLPHASISIIERQSRLGGWIQSTTVHHDSHSILLESGPRSIRPVGISGAITLSLIQQLGLSPYLHFVSKSSPASTHRYMIYNDRVHLLPTSIFSAVLASISPSSPLFSLIPSILNDLISPRHSYGDDIDRTDESIASFLSRRFSPRLVYHLVTAIIHGIYAGDPHQLSVRATMPKLFDAEQSHGSVILGLLRNTSSSSHDKQSLHDLFLQCPSLQSLWSQASLSSIYSLRGGLGSLINALSDHLSTRNNVTIHTNVSPTRIHADNNLVSIELNDGNLILANQLISAIPTLNLHSLLKPSSTTTNDLTSSCQNALLFHAKTPAVTVAVTNVVFRTKDIPHTVLQRTQGFGILSPITKGSRTDPYLLGIIYDSSAIPSLAEPEFTKYTVMMGGHYFNNQLSSLPSLSELESRALASIRYHLSIPEWSADPIIIRTLLHSNCIPQYQVGHVHQLHSTLQTLPSHIHLIGSWYSGVGVNDCVKSAWDVSNTIRNTLP